ncbi:MAG: HEAT repeat domain-containing protein [Planctomycetota bacterium]
MSARAAAVLFLLTFGGGCSPFRPLLLGDTAVSPDLIRRAGRSTDPRLDEPLLRILDARIAMPDDLAAAARAQAAALALAERRTTAAVPRLAALSVDPDPAVRCGILEALARLGGAEAEATLRRVAATDPDPRARSLAARLGGSRAERE